METVAWVGALETAIALLYLAIIGQRSIAQWLDDRRSRSLPATTTEPEATKAVSSTHLPVRSLSVQSIRDYVEYVWRDPVEAALITGKALTLGTVLLFGTATLLLLLGALAVATVAYFSGSRELGQLAQSIGGAGGNTAIIMALGIMLAIFDLLGISLLASDRQLDKEIQERRTEDERRKERRAELAKRRRSAQE